MALLVFLQLNCKKEDFYNSKINVTEKFFELPPNTDPIIKRIVEDLKQKNALHPFVEQFVKKEGYPVWQYAKISSTQNYSANFTAGEGDTLVSVPVVPDGASYVKDVLKIKMDTELLYKLFVGENYAENGFDKNPDRTEPNADDIVKQIMAFEKEMYYAADSTVIYHIKDNRLFDYWPADTTKPQDFYVALRLDLFEIEYPCILSFTYIVGWAPLNGNVEGGCEPGAPCNPYVPVYNTSTYDGFCIAWVEVGGGGTEGWTSYPEGEPGGGEGTTTPPDSTSNPPNTLPEGCEDRNWVVYVIDTNTGEWKNPCTQEPPPVGWGDEPGEYDPYIADEVILDTSITNNYPCLVNIIDTLSQFANLNQTAQVALNTIFGVNKYIHTTIKMDPSLIGHPVSAETDGIRTDIVGSSDTVHYNITIRLNPDMMEKATKEYIISTITHEAMHGYIQYIFKQYYLEEVDSNYVKSLFPLFWGSVGFAPSAQQEHQLMANNWVNTIANTLNAFPNNSIDPSLKDSIYRSLGWGGLYETDAFKLQSGKCNILAINFVANNRSVSAGSSITFPSYPECSQVYSFSADSLKLKAPCD